MAERIHAAGKKPETRQARLPDSRKAVRINPGPLPPVPPGIRFQQTAGNRAVQRMLKSGRLLAKLRIGQPNDRYEQEADRVAEQIMRMPDPGVQRKCPPKEKCPYEEEKTKGLVQLKMDQSSSGAESAPDTFLSSLEQGQPLDSATRAFFEPRFGVDFSNVRVHTGSQATESARVVDALAYTCGNNIVFGKDQYRPHNSSWKKLVAHELTHIIQQEGSQIVSNKTIQRWGPGVHERLTRDEIENYPLLKSLKKDAQTYDKLLKQSTDMDLRFPELWFNFRGLLIKKSGEKRGDPFSDRSSFPNDEFLKTRAERALQSHYAANPEKARNHGEGGLYSANVPKSVEINKAHEYKYVTEARNALKMTTRNFSSYTECERTKKFAHDVMLRALGDAFHVAQDRGSHGEGAVNCGHHRELTTEGFEPDNPGINTQGYLSAKRNTELLVMVVEDILRVLLDEKYRRTCSYVRPSEVQVIQRKNAYKSPATSNDEKQSAYNPMDKIP